MSNSPTSMPFAADRLRGPLFMVISTGSYVASDTFMKAATAGLPPYEILLLRGISATLWGIPLLFALGYGRAAALMFEPRVLVRNLFETASILAYIVALANMQIADASALMQITPLLVMVGAALLLRERIGISRMALILVGFAGVLLVVQPTMRGVSVYALLALATAVLGAGRDLAGRCIDDKVPGMIVAMSAVIVVLAGAGVAHLASEQWVTPGVHHMMLMAGAGLFLIFGHFFLFMAYRVGPTDITAPFYYAFTIWAMISGLVVFGQFPNAMAVTGIALVMASGVAILLIDRHDRRRAMASLRAGQSLDQHGG